MDITVIHYSKLCRENKIAKHKANHRKQTAKRHSAVKCL